MERVNIEKLPEKSEKKIIEDTINKIHYYATNRGKVLKILLEVDKDLHEKVAGALMVKNSAPYFFDLIENISSFSLSDERKTEIAEIFIERYSSSCNILLNAIRNFPSLDCNKVVDKLIKDDKWQDVIWAMCDLFGLDNQVANKFIELKRFKSVGLNLCRFKNLSLENFKLLIKNGFAKNCLANLLSFEKIESSDIEELQVEIKSASLEISLTQRETQRYDNLNKLLQLHDSLENKKEIFGFESQADVDEELEKLEQKNNFFIAFEFIKCAKQVGFKFKPEKIHQITLKAFEEIEKRKQKKQRENISGIDVAQEVSLFYLNDMIEAEINKIKFRMGKGNFSKSGIELDERELPFRGKVLLRDFENKELNDEFYKKIFEWVRQYIITVIHSQVSEQCSNISLCVNANEMKKAYTPQQIRQFLLECRVRFGEEKRFIPSISIVEQALEMWQDDIEIEYKKRLIDRAFQIEHIHDYIFSANYDQSFYNKQFLRQILDIKFKAKDLNDLFAKLSSFITDKEKLLNIKAKLENLEKLKKMTLRTKGSME